MPLTEKEISKILEFTEKLDLSKSHRMSQIARLTDLRLSSIFKAADIIGLNYDYNPNTKVHNKQLTLILQSIIENAEVFDTSARNSNPVYKDLIKQIEISGYISSSNKDLKFPESRPYLNYKTLFKYQPVNDNAFASLEQAYIYHSKVMDFNDPFDCNARLLDKISRKDSYAIEAELPVVDFIKHIGIACFSKNNSSILMWSHYADKHQGICIEYNSFELNAGSKRYFTDSIDSFHQNLLKYSSNVFDKIYEVKYFDELARHTAMLSRKGFSRTVNRLFLTKYVDWKYEQEVRRIIYLKTPDSVDDRKFHHSPDLIVAIYIGVHASDSTIVKIRKIVKEKYNNTVKLYKASLSNKTFGIEFNLITYL